MGRDHQKAEKLTVAVPLSLVIPELRVGDKSLLPTFPRSSTSSTGEIGGPGFYSSGQSGLQAWTLILLYGSHLT